MTKKRLLDIDIAIAISIILVVYGHLLFDDSLPDWYVKSRTVVYNFHMPLFMFFSGFLMALSYKPIQNGKAYGSFIWKKAQKFIPAYLLFSAIFIVLETLRNGFTVEQLKIDLIDMVLSPSKAPAGFLWYIYILLQYYIILPLIMWLGHKHWSLILILGIACHLLNVTTSFLNLDLFCYYLLFVVLGILANTYFDKYYMIISKLGWIFLIVFLVQVCFNVIETSKMVLGLLSIPSIHYLSIQFEKTPLASQLSNIGRLTYYIYLMNTLVMGSLYVILTSYFKLELNLMWIIILFLSGIFIPMFVYKQIIRKVPVLNMIIK